MIHPRSSGTLWSPHRNVPVWCGTTFFSLACGLLAVATGMVSESGAQGPVFINEIFFNPGGDGSDGRDEYIEIRGNANAPLADHYLLIIESENNGETGFIENIFDLGDFSLGSNGFLVLRQKFSRYGDPSPINPAATDLVNDGPNLPGPAFPGFGDGENSTIGASDLPSLGSGPGDGQLEGSGFTAMLIRNLAGEAPAWARPRRRRQRPGRANRRRGLGDSRFDRFHYRTR